MTSEEAHTALPSVPTDPFIVRDLNFGLSVHVHTTSHCTVCLSNRHIIIMQINGHNFATIAEEALGPLYHQKILESQYASSMYPSISTP